MTILFIQTCINLFTNEIASQNTDPIDIVVRTTAAAIFGYFISANFIKNETDTTNENLSTQSKILNINPTNTSEISHNTYKSTQIGFSSNKSEDIKTHSTINQIDLQSQDSVNLPSNSLQIIIITIISLSSLIVLLIARNYTPITSESMGSISQLRDFVCGGVGFLLGYPTTSIKNK